MIKGIKDLKENKKALDAAEFVRGAKLNPGDFFE